MKMADIDKIVQFTKEPSTAIYIWEYQKDKLLEILQSKEGLVSIADVIGFLIREYELKKEFFDEEAE